jgi:hypothetical protein
VDSTHLQRIEALLDSTGFWRASSWENSQVRDGAAWVFEAVDPHRYHVVARRFPPSDGAVRSAVMYLLQLSELDLDPIYE